LLAVKVGVLPTAYWSNKGKAFVYENSYKQMLREYNPAAFCEAEL
jgi:hypothetical protein